MASRQRRRGEPVKIWRTVTVTDRRGNTVIVADEDGPHEERASVSPQRSARAEVPGQVQINVLRLIVAADLDDVNLWSRVEYRGLMWDVVTPPAYHHGSRKTRHWSIDIRERPTSG